MRDIASIVGLKVIASKEGREVGAVSQVVVDLASGAIEGVLVGKGPAEKGIDAADIDVIGTDAVMVGTYRVAKPLSELPRLLQRRRDPEKPPREVLTDTGKRIGMLGTIYIDPHSKRVTRYEISGGAWRDLTEGVLSLPPMEGTVDGHDSVIVPTAAFAGVGGTSGGLKAQLTKLGELARTQAKQAAEGLEGGVQGMKRGVESVSERASEAATKVKQSVSERAAAVAEKREATVQEKREASATDKPEAAPAPKPEAPKPEADNLGESLLKKLRQGVAVVSERAQEAAAKVTHKDEAAPDQAETDTAPQPETQPETQLAPEGAEEQPQPCCAAEEKPVEESAPEPDADVADDDKSDVQS